MSLRIIFLLAGATALLTACASLYRSETTYTAPTSSEGRSCVSACEGSNNQCRSKAKLRAENSQPKCEHDARDDFERCLATAQGELGRSSCTRRYCSRDADTSDCKTDYDLCFQNCGGTVSSEQQCRFLCP